MFLAYLVHDITYLVMADPSKTLDGDLCRPILLPQRNNEETQRLLFLGGPRFLVLVREELRVLSSLLEGMARLTNFAGFAFGNTAQSSPHFVIKLCFF